MQRHIFILLFFCVSFFSNAQNKITYGSPYTVIDGHYKTYFSKLNLFLAVKVEAERLFVQVFDDSTLTERKKETFKLTSRHVLEKIVEIDGKCYIFSSLENNKERNVSLYCREIDPDKTPMLREEKIVLKTQTKVYGIPISHLYGSRPAQDNTEETTIRPKFNFEFSLNKENIGIHYRPINSSRDNMFVVHILTKNLVEVSSKKTTFPFDVNDTRTLDYCISKSGMIYIASNVFNESIPAYKRVDGMYFPYHTIIVSIPLNNDFPLMHTIPFVDKNISGLKFAEDSSGSIHIGGYYFTGINPANTKGLITGSLNSKGEVNPLYLHEISLDIINRYTDSTLSVSNNLKDNQSSTVFEDLILKKVLIDDSNNILIIGEQEFDITKTKAHPNDRFQTDLIYHYNDILVAKITNEGTLLWMNRLAKRQMGGQEKGGLSYRHVRFNNMHYFLFLDNIKNENISYRTLPYGHINEQGGFLTAYIVDNTTGTVTRKSYLNLRNPTRFSLYHFNPTKITRSNGNEIIVEFYKKMNEDILIKINLDSK